MVIGRPQQRNRNKKNNNNNNISASRLVSMSQINGVDKWDGLWMIEWHFALMLMNYELWESRISLLQGPHIMFPSSIASLTLSLSLSQSGLVYKFLFLVPLSIGPSFVDWISGETFCLGPFRSCSSWSSKSIVGVYRKPLQTETSRITRYIEPRSVTNALWRCYEAHWE